MAVLGHLQRGGTPTPFDRVLATRFSVKAMELVASGQFNHTVALQGNQLVAVPIEKVMNQQRLVPTDHELIKFGLSIGTSFGVAM